MELRADGLACERGGRQVFAGLAFAIASGQLMQLTGPNGAGKSSLLRLIAGLAEWTGSLTLAGGSVDLTVGQHAHFIAHQEAVKGALTVGENLRFWRDFLGGGDLSAALASFSLEHLSDYPASYLSEGQRRRLALSRLALTPRPLWLLDEPTVGLDAASQKALAALMQAHLARDGMIMAATHAPLGLDPHLRLDLTGAAS